MYILIFSNKFQKELAKLIKGNNPLKLQVKKTIKLMEKDLNHSSLRLHKLSGVNFWSISVNKSIRIITHWNEDKLHLLGIGKHEDVY